MIFQQCEMKPNVLLFLTPAHVLKTASALRVQRVLRAALVQEVHEVREESQVHRVQWDHVGNRVHQVQWDHQVHRVPMDCLFPVNQGGLDLKETLVTQVYLDREVPLVLRVLWALSDLPEDGDHQGMKAPLDQEVHQDQWDHQDHLGCQETLDNKEKWETSAPKDLWARKGRRVNGETLHPRI